MISDDGRARFIRDHLPKGGLFVGQERRISPVPFLSGENLAKEIGISTDKIGARGPMGLDELTTYKWLGIGNGQVRT